MPNYFRTAIHTVSDIQTIADHAGSHFFSPGAMRFFSSRVSSRGVFAVDGAEALPGRRYLFITSEVHGDEPRHYAVRMMTLGMVRDDRPAVDIVTVGDYWPALDVAVSAAKSYAEAMRMGLTV